MTYLSGALDDIPPIGMADSSVIRKAETGNDLVTESQFAVRTLGSRSWGKDVQPQELLGKVPSKPSSSVCHID